MDEFTSDQTPASIWLSYSLTRSITPALQRQFLHQFPDLADLAALLGSDRPTLQTPDQTFNQKASDALAQRYASPVIEKVQAALDWEHQSTNHHIIGLNHPAYPKLLRTTGNAPPVLYVNGNPDTLNTPCVAIVGARKASHGALELASEIAHKLTENGITVISGLALGVDAAAHRGALRGNGYTIAVSATGAERVYPRSHLNLAKEIVSSGAIVTEFPLNNNLQPHCFPRRNRIISGMSMGVLVVEAALPSGTLTTAQHALRQGREVMAIPGAVQNPMTHGCHELLKNGAALIENADDVMHCLSAELQRHLIDVSAPNNVPHDTAVNKKLNNLPPDTITLLDCLGFDPVSVDTLVRRSGLDAAQVAGALTHLELSGVIVAAYGGRYTRL